MPAKYDVTPHSILNDCQPSVTWCQVKKKKSGKKTSSQRQLGGRVQGLLIILPSAVLLIDPPELPPPESPLRAFSWKKKGLIHPRRLLSAANNLFCILFTIYSSTLGNRSRIGEPQAAVLPYGSRQSDVFVPPTSLSVREWAVESGPKREWTLPLSERVPAKMEIVCVRSSTRWTLSHLGGVIDQPRCIFGVTVYWQRCHLLKSWPC